MKKKSTSIQSKNLSEIVQRPHTKTLRKKYKDVSKKHKNVDF